MTWKGLSSVLPAWEGGSDFDCSHGWLRAAPFGHRAVQVAAPKTCPPAGHRAGSQPQHPECSGSSESRVPCLHRQR